MGISVELVGLIIALLWLGALTYLFIRLRSHYNNLAEGNNKKSLQELLEDILQDKKASRKDIDSLLDRCDRIEKQGLYYIQKIGLLRYNPFKDTGGDQSFVVALVDANNTGIVISGLFSRSGTRWYAKRVVEGKGTEHELTTEEIKAITNAKSSVK